MTTLANFPALSQLTMVTSDGKPSENAVMDCVPASIGMAILYYQGLEKWTMEINPDHLKDLAYPGEYTGGTAASAYVGVCEHLGYKLYPVNGDTAFLVQQIHAKLQAGIPVVITIPDIYVPASYNWSHVVVAFGESPGEITFMDPYVAHSMTKSDSELAGLLEFGQIWPIERIEDVPVVIDLNNPEVASFFSAAPGGTWICKQTGKSLIGGILAEYCRYGNAGLCGLSWLGLPKSNEIPVEQLSSDPKLAGHGIKIQFFERGVLAYDEAKLLDNPPGVGSVYPVHLYQGVGSDPLVAQLEAQLAILQKQQAPLAIPSTLVADMQLIKVTSSKY